MFVTTENEVTILFQNTKIFNEMLNFFKESYECFFILLRQARTLLLNKEITLNISNSINKARFKIGRLYEEFLVQEAISRVAKPLKANNNTKKITFSAAKEKQEKLKKLLIFLKNKFKFHSIHWKTRDSKINFNKKLYNLHIINEFIIYLISQSELTKMRRT
jgi:hypothetical protein